MNFFTLMCGSGMLLVVLLGGANFVGQIVEVKRSGTKLTVKRDAPQSPANIRPVDEKSGSQNLRHTHAKAPKSMARK